MAFGNEILFARIAAYNGLVTMDQLEQCLDLQRRRAPSKHIGQIMIERRLIDEVQARAVLTAQRRRLHKGERPEEVQIEKQLCESLILDGAIDQRAITRARESKGQMQERGLFPSLGDILVQQGTVSLSRLSDVQSRINLKDLWCASCGKKYRASLYRPGLDVRCRKCGGRLEPTEPEPPEPPADDELTVEMPPPQPPSEPVESFEVPIPSEVRSRTTSSPFPRAGIGEVVGNCRLEEKLGEGGWGEVYRAKHLSLERDSAIKILAPQHLCGSHLVQRFMAEARTAAGLTHPNIVAVHNVGEDHGIHFMEMQFVPGKTLYQTLVEKGRFGVREALLIARQAAAGLDYAHKHKIVHRDIKPGNIMIDASGHVTILDFGLTKRMDSDTNLTSVNYVLGTLQYMSPEQADGRPLDGRSDLYSLGVTLYEMITGTVPFAANSPATFYPRLLNEPPPDPCAFRPDIPESAAKLLLRLLAKDPGSRPGSGDNIVKEIVAMLGRR